MVTSAKPRTAITFDVDWAPEICILECIALCIKYQVPATFFVTHSSEALDGIRHDPLFELGIHPNFLPGSGHGSDFEEVLDYCMRLVPGARSMRTHGLVQSSRLFYLISQKYPNIRTDVSLFLPLHKNLEPTELWLGDGYPGLVRLPYFWEDDAMSVNPNWSWTAPLPESKGLQIYDFHPIHVGLNMETMDRYSRLKRTIGRRKLFEASAGELETHRNHGEGTLTFLERLFKAVPRNEFATISSLTSNYSAGECV